MLINVVLQTKFKLGAVPVELNELLLVKATHSNYALTIYHGKMFLLSRLSQLDTENLKVEERKRKAKTASHSR